MLIGSLARAVACAGALPASVKGLLESTPSALSEALALTWGGFLHTAALGRLLCASLASRPFPQPSRQPPGL